MEVSSTTFWVFGMTRPEMEPQCPGPFANILPLSQWAGHTHTHEYIYIYNYLLNAETRSKFLCLSYTKQRNIFTEKEHFKEKGERKNERQMKRRLFNCSP